MFFWAKIDEKTSLVDLFAMQNVHPNPMFLENRNMSLPIVDIRPGLRSTIVNCLQSGVFHLPFGFNFYMNNLNVNITLRGYYYIVDFQTEDT